MTTYQPSTETGAHLKRCTGCLCLLPLDCFTRNQGLSDGYMSKCKPCSRIDARANTARHRAHYEAYRSARKTIEHALRNGWIARQSCEVCGDRHAEPHPDDYDKPLNVRWLCVEHYRQQHRRSAP